MAAKIRNNTIEVALGLLGCRPGAAITCVLPRATGVGNKVICRWLPLVLGLDVPRRGHAANQHRLGLGLGPPVRVTGHAEARYCLLRDFRT